MAKGIERIRLLLQRAKAELDTAKIPYAVIGANAVAERVGQVDEGAVRFTRDVDVLLRREDMPAAIRAMTAGGFDCERAMGVEIFPNDPDSKPSEAVLVIFAGEKVKQELYPVPAVTMSTSRSLVRPVRYGFPR